MSRDKRFIAGGSGRSPKTGASRAGAVVGNVVELGIVDDITQSIGRIAGDADLGTDIASTGRSIQVYCRRSRIVRIQNKSGGNSISGDVHLIGGIAVVGGNFNSGGRVIYPVQIILDCPGSRFAGSLIDARTPVAGGIG